MGNTYAITLIFISGVSEYVLKSQKWSDHTDVQCQNGQTAMSQAMTFYVLLKDFNFDGSDHIWAIAAASTIFIDTSHEKVFRYSKMSDFFPTQPFPFFQIIMVAPFDFQIT